MILMSSFLPVRYKQPSGTARTNLRFVNIIKSFYDDHAGITGIFMILRDVYIRPTISYNDFVMDLPIV